MSVAVFNLEGFTKKAKRAASVLARTSTLTKNAVLEEIALQLENRIDEIVVANQKDLDAAIERDIPKAMVDRMRLTPERIKALAGAVREIVALPDPVGEITHAWRRPNGIEVGKQRIPLGLIMMIYESRPNVTIDAAALCLKAGNGVILRGGSEAFHSNQFLANLLVSALEKYALPGEVVSMVPTTDRSTIDDLLKQDEWIDLVIPRGGESLIRRVAEVSRIPVIKHYKGVCHLYVDEHANLQTALDLLLDGKTSRPGVCNALETVLIHKNILPDFAALALPALKQAGVEVRGDETLLQLDTSLTPAQEDDWHAEYLDLILAMKAVNSLDEAMEHIQIYGSEHTEVIATESYSNGQRFLNEVCASVVMINASSRFSDGGQLGLGAEIGISTTKLHAFGPMGLTSLTTEKFIVRGNGQTRH
jgi:glutamate-5-semialdehyde dehydrogenase